MPEKVRDLVETFHGGQCELSNLHKCPEGCEFEAEGTVFPTSEHHYQFQKLKVYDKAAEAYEVLMEADSFKAMKLANTILPTSEVTEEWKDVARQEMLCSY